MAPRASTGYLLESPDEGYRLMAKVDPPAWAHRYLSGLACEGPILDVGCGPGHLLEAAADLHQRAGFGVDLSTERLRQRTDTTYGVCADAHRLPFRDSVFGLTFARFLLEYMSSPNKVVAELIRVTAVGGHVLLQDLDGQLTQHYPTDPHLEAGIRAFIVGSPEFDTQIGRKLFALARERLTDISVQMEPYHLIVGRADDTTLQLWDLKLTNALPAASAVLGTQEARVLKQRFLDYLADPATITFSNVFTLIGRVAPAAIE